MDRNERDEVDLKITLDPTVRLPLRAGEPSEVEVFLGPTNSGKTHRALERLAERGVGTYAAPLRMLAMEAYERLCGDVGEDRVGLVTGEERINHNAPIICATAEMAPMRGELLVLDEVQWAADPDRGWAWTRLLAGADVDELYVTGEVGAAPFVRAVLGDDVPITWTERLVPLSVRGPLTLDSIPDRSIVVAFSRKAVLHLAGLLHLKRRRVSALYGALPPEVRRKQIAEFIVGSSEIIVATDVIGHGINLPANAVVFSETEKFDGQKRRDLEAWEIAQIAGRAGRFGLSESGVVTTVGGVTGFAPKHRMVARALTGKVMIEGKVAHRRVERGQVAPGLDDLGALSASDLAPALNAWSKAAKAALGSTSWASVAPVEPFLERANALDSEWTSSGSLLSRLSLDDAWRLLRSPLDADTPEDRWVLGAVARELLGTLTVTLEPISASTDAVSLERHARVLVGLRWATLAFAERIALSHREVVEQLDAVATALNAALARAITNGVARCVSCNSLCAPWCSECDSCHSSRHHSSRHHSYGRDDGYDGFEYADYDDYAGAWYGCKGGRDDFDLTLGRPKAKKAPSKAKAAKRARELDRKVRRREEVQRTLRAAVASDPILARPRGVARGWWANEAIPALEATSRGAEREQLLLKVLEVWGQEGVAAKIRERVSAEATRGGVESPR